MPKQKSEQSTPVEQTRVGDVLYALEIRTQEMAMYADKASFHLRYGPIHDDEQEPTTMHFRMLVLEMSCELDMDVNIGRRAPKELTLLKCGWQLEVHTQEAVAPDQVPMETDELPYLLGRVQETIGLLCEKSGIENPLTAEVLETILTQEQ